MGVPNGCAYPRWTSQMDIGIPDGGGMRHDDVRLPQGAES